MTASSLDLRRHALADRPAGRTFAAVARRYSASAEWVRIVSRRFEPTDAIVARL